ncbi:D-lactate dehydrogenase [Calderihabitans maritimus]|uniref:D-lactate dehydrogenase (cytochrome) n=1 Tax=Calderihabitans maritimus TaxID=1246530 RepID=A0A1Z5HVD0_9FIRM|nr:FAD-linked oxidase C-terminal domain-containing protein [Calderihabitans maritimus]GAW93499.1 D-lactate dehydrogenase [Calderihabitans maritimus]
MKNQALVKDLVALIGPDKVISEELDLLCYSYDSSFKSRNHRFVPDAVVTPRSTEEVSKIMKYAYANNIPVTPRGAATGETCGAVPVRGGIVLDLSTWDTIEEIDTSNMQAIVRPGVVHANLNKELAKYGLFFPPDPGSSRMCTIGGMVANNSSGLRAVKYGTTENYVLGLEVVLPYGDVIVTGGMKSRAIKNVSGMNLTKLFVGSEGTLGVITRVRLRVWPKPKARGILMAVFPDLEDAPQTVLEVYQAGILPAGIEILDDSAIKAVNEYKPEINLPDAQAILLFELDGNPASVEWEGNEVARIAKKRASQVEWSTDPERMAQLWEGRSVTAAAAARVRPDGSRVFAGEDISVPLSKVTECLRRIKELGEKYGVGVVNYGHIGDGNVHTAPVIDPESPEEIERVEKFADAIHRLAVELGGSTTGEHGVGLVRAPYARLEHGPAVDIMLLIKRALDPKGIMNPGKLLPEEEEARVS